MTTTKEKAARGANPERPEKDMKNLHGYSSTSIKSRLEIAKERIGITDAWVRLGLPEKPCKPGKSCGSPFREDKDPSLGITPDDKHWKDYATGERGDVVDFIAKARQCSMSDAAKVLIEWADGARHTPTKAYALAVRAVTSGQKETVRPKIELKKPTDADIRTIQANRALPSNGGLYMAVERGLLWMADVWDNGEYARCWVVTDNARIGAQARRMDGKHFTRNGTTFKSKTLPGFKAAWPVGAANIGGAQNVILTEGPPDMLAAMVLAYVTPGCDPDGIGFACVCGAGNYLMPESLTHFEGKNVRLVFDQDPAGMGARERWCRQLTDAGANVETFSIEGMMKKDGTPAKDLNDVTYWERDDGENAGPDLPAELEELLDFSGKGVAQ